MSSSTPDRPAGSAAPQTQRHQEEAALWDTLSERDAHALALPDGYDLYAYARKRAVRAFALEHLGDIAGKRLLDCGTGTGMLACLAARSGADVWAFDISPRSIELARERARMCGVANRTHFTVRPAEDTGYEDAFFDGALGMGVLHHVQVDAALREVRRVLKPGGRAGFLEAWDGNPVFRLIRKMHTNEGDEWPLTPRDIATARELFSGVDYKVFELTETLGVLTGARPHLLERVDAMLFRAAPFVRRWGKSVALQLTR